MNGYACYVRANDRVSTLKSDSTQSLTKKLTQTVYQDNRTSECFRISNTRKLIWCFKSNPLEHGLLLFTRYSILRMRVRKNISNKALYNSIKSNERFAVTFNPETCTEFSEFEIFRISMFTFNIKLLICFANNIEPLLKIQYSFTCSVFLISRVQKSTLFLSVSRQACYICLQYFKCSEKSTVSCPFHV